MRKEHENFVTELEALLDKHNVCIDIDASAYYGHERDIDLYFSFLSNGLEVSSVSMSTDLSIKLTKDNIKKQMR